MISIIFLVAIFKNVLCIKIGSYNTYQYLTNPLASTLRGPQIQQIGNSSLDVICLQELSTMGDLLGYTSSLEDKEFTESFSVYNIHLEDSPQQLTVPRIPCTQLQIQAANSSCIQQCPYGEVTWVICVATLCPSDWDQLLYSECFGCLVAYVGIQPLLADNFPQYTPDINGVAQFCLNPPDLTAFGVLDFGSILYNVTEGTAIVSKSNYPIKRTWSYIIPSWILGEQRLNIAEINICADTSPYNNQCEDSIIIGCTHLGTHIISYSLRYCFRTKKWKFPTIHNP